MRIFNALILLILVELIACVDSSSKREFAAQPVLSDSLAHFFQTKYKLVAIEFDKDSIYVNVPLPGYEIASKDKTELISEIISCDLSRSGSSSLKKIIVECSLEGQTKINEQYVYDQGQTKPMCFEFSSSTYLLKNITYIYKNVKGAEIERHNFSLRRLASAGKGRPNFPLSFIELVQQYSLAREQNDEIAIKHFRKVLKYLEDAYRILKEDSPTGANIGDINLDTMAFHVDYFLNE